MKKALSAWLVGASIFLGAAWQDGPGKGPSTAAEPAGAQSSPAGQKEAGAKSAKHEAPNESKRGPQSVDWHSLIPTIRTVLKQHLPGGQNEPRYPIRIAEEADITGDGVPEALVYTGDGGASTDFLVLMRIEDGKPVLARFKNADGKIADPNFLVGSSVMHGDSTEMLPDEKAIYLGEYVMNNTGTGFSSCSAKAYRWNAKTKTFDWNRALSEQITRTFCEREKERQ